MVIKKFAIARAIGGISLNGNEYLLDSSGEILLFDTEEEAEQYIIDNGIDVNSSAWEIEMEVQNEEK